MIKKLLDIDKKFIKGTTIVAIGNVVARVLAFVFFIVLARFCVKEDYGFIRYVITVGTLASVIVIGGFPVALTRFIAKFRYNKKKLITYCSNCLMGITLLLILILVIFSILSVTIFKYNIRYIIGILFVIIGLTIYSTYFSIVRGFLLYKKIAFLAISSTAFKILFIVVASLIFSIYSPILVLFIFSFSVLLSIIISESIKPINLNFKISAVSIDVIKKLSKFVAPVLVNAILIYTLSGIGTITIEHFWALKDVAEYSVALTLSSVFIFISQGITTILMPKVGAMKNAGPIIRYLRQSIILILSTSIPIFVIYYFCGSWIIHLLFGEKYLASFNVSIILSLGMIFYSIYTVFVAIWNAIGKPEIYMKIMLISSPTTIFLTYILVPIHGAIGAAFSLSVGYLVAVLVSTFIFRMFPISKYI